MNTHIPKHGWSKAVVTALCAICAFGVAAAPDVSGAKPGVWTQDYDAALALAKADNLPLMLNFTGSDWCGWCKLMDKQVFSTDAWKDWAKDNIVLAFIDFPRNKSLVPEKYVKRNKDLADKYGIRGYPTFVLVDPSTGKTIGTLGASRGASPEAFIKDIKQAVFKSSSADVAKYLAAEDAKAYETLKAEADKANSEYETFIKKTTDELQLLNQALRGAKDAEVRKNAEAAFKARYDELSKAAKEMVDRKNAAESKLSAIIDKALEAKKNGSL